MKLNTITITITTTITITITITITVTVTVTVRMKKTTCNCSCWLASSVVAQEVSPRHHWNLHAEGLGGWLSLMSFSNMAA